MLFVSCIVFITSGCDENPGNVVRPVDPRPGSNNELSRINTCEGHRECSGEDCCGEDDDCRIICRELFDNGADYGVCVNEYDKELVTQLEKVDEILDRPNISNLNKINTEPLCALLQLSPDKWLKKINERYTAGNAEVVIEWVFSQGILHLFSEPEDRLDVIRGLLVARTGRGGQITDANILDGLARQTVQDRKIIFYISDYVGEAGKLGFQLIHNELIVGDICDTESNQPHPNSTGTRKDGSNCYYNNPRNGYQFDAAIEQKEQACVLALYCVAGPDNNSKRDRKRIADLVNNNGVVDFIETAVVDGGLGVTQEAEEWPSSACSELKNFWHNKTLDFDLGTGKHFPQSATPPCSR